MTRLAVAMGAQPHTVSGLTGIGGMVVFLIAFLF